ncbi:hypothetical protein CPB83DRAFT_896670 [Crepidotus variabilis]|uniref:DUF6534 domain-containing protein n=1 Tax=Crepidotus variabilis TaxID=179855 RepID=A0A9P6JME2_9AGAR|nr:hypothetical protein CPB83DRAFT_896670 [Crepidotus variabilis]
MSAPAAPPMAIPIPPNIGAIAGPLVVGYLLHWGLFGVLSTQLYIYHIAFPEDPRGTQALVYGVYIVEFVQTILFSYTAFNTFAKGFGNMMAIIDESILWFSVPIMSSAVAMVVQVFYAYRIWKIGESRYVAGVVILLALAQLGGGLATGIIAHEVVDFTKFLNKRTLIATGIWNGASALCDVVIAAAMTFYLQKRSTKWSPTQRVVQKIIRLVIETGTLTAVIALINLALSLLPGQPTYFQATSGILGKMYSNTMMAVFNSRVAMRLAHSESSQSGSAGRFESVSRGNNNAYSSRPIVLEPQRVDFNTNRSHDKISEAF